MLEVTNEMAKTQHGTAVVYFTAEWCVPCRQLKPQFAKAGTIDKVNNYYIVDVEKIEQEYLDKYSIKSVPQMYAMHDGNISVKLEGKTADEILEEVNNVLV
jgi:thioredoxin 1